MIHSRFTQCSGVSTAYSKCSQAQVATAMSDRCQPGAHAAAARDVCERPYVLHDAGLRHLLRGAVGGQRCRHAEEPLP